MAAMREGDWNCASCGNHNFANRTVCNRCSAPNPNGSAMPGYGPLKANGAGRPSASPYAPAAPTDDAAPNGRPGDWVCSSCSNVNYAMRTACNRCKLPRGMAGGMQGQQGGMPQMRPGDWTCRACNNHNFANRESCNKCNIPKNAFISQGGMRDGDWICMHCANHNYADKTACNKCGQPKGAAVPYSTAAIQKATKKPVQVREGDWNCSACGNHNYANREVCNKCQGPKTVTNW